MRFIILILALLALCTPVQEIYLTPAETVSPENKNKKFLEGKDIISIDTIDNRHETVIRVRYREKE